MNKLIRLLKYLRYDLIKLNWDGQMTSHEIDDDDDQLTQKTSINPATGYSMVGALDSMGNTMGSNASSCSSRTPY